MSISLNDLLERNIFASFRIISAPDHLQETVSGVSILETPDFEKYIIDGTLILTTFFIINKNVELFQNLIETLSHYHSPGIVIKLYRYIDEIPEVIIQQSNACQIPIIVLDYDANLSVIYNAIYAEIQSDDYLEQHFHSKFVSSMALIEKNPSTSALIEATAQSEELEIFFYNYDTGKSRYSNPIMLSLFEEYAHQNEHYFRIHDNILYKEDIYFNDQKIYMFLLYTSNSRRHIIHTYSEIYNILITLIYQKKKEILTRQDLFLVNFISNFTSFHSSNQDMIHEGKLYHWNIVFPVIMILFTFNEAISTVISSINKLPDRIKYTIMKHTACQSDEIKYIFFDNQILFIENDKGLPIDECIEQIYQELSSSLLETTTFTISYTPKIYYSKDLPAYYRNLVEISNYLLTNKSNPTIVTPSLIQFIKIIKEFNSLELNTMMNDLLKPLIDYEQKHDINLCETLLMYYKCQFQLKETSKRLYIHYNTLKYRLSLIEKLGYPISSMQYDYAPLLMALYMRSLNMI